MTTKKFNEEINTLKYFFECFCKSRHYNQKLHTKELTYKDTSFTLELNLCKECLEDIEYCLERLQECPHDEKPRCRTCPTPCYEKDQWKKTAKVMMYSGIRLGLSKKIRKIFKK